MKYKNAAEILPESLLRELQAYCAGDILYIPKMDTKADWGEASGSRRYYLERNKGIKDLYHGGKTISELALQYGLATSTIKRIIYS